MRHFQEFLRCRFFILMPNNKIKILALCDSPTAATGFAQVSRNVLNGLANTGRYDIDVIGINFHGDYYDQQKFPYRIFPAMPQGWTDMYGRDRVVSALSGNQIKHGLEGPWDIIFTVQDPFVIEGLGLNYPFGEQLRVTQELWKRTVPADQWFTWVGYWPVDAEVKENWVTKSVALPDFPVAYCEWGKERILKWDRDDLKIGFNLKLQDTGETKKGKLPIPSVKDRIKVINHGVDLNVFKPLPKTEILEFREKFFGGKIKPDTYLVVNVSRNQPRKDIQRTITVFSQFKKVVPEAHLYLHMQASDAGGSIDEMARNVNLKPGEDYSVPRDFNSGVGFSVEIVNQIYNAADLCITTTLGEGWGFITSEAMATKTPIVAPNITSILDIFDSRVPEEQDLNEWLSEKGWDQVRGIPAKAGSTNSEWVCLGVDDNERIRPLTNVDDMVYKMIWAYQNPKAVQQIVDRAYEWVQSLSWPNIVNQWDELFQEAYKRLVEQREMGDKIDKAGRNDLCPCGSGEKFKKCHLERMKTDKKFSDWLE